MDGNMFSGLGEALSLFAFLALAMTTGGLLWLLGIAWVWLYSSGYGPTAVAYTCVGAFLLACYRFWRGRQEP